MQAKGKAIDFMASRTKAELLDHFKKVLDTDEARILLITGVPGEKVPFTIEVHQSGHCYWYEAQGLLREAGLIIDRIDADLEDDDDDS